MFRYGAPSSRPLTSTAAKTSGRDEAVLAIRASLAQTPWRRSRAPGQRDTPSWWIPGLAYTYPYLVSDRGAFGSGGSEFGSGAEDAPTAESDPALEHDLQQKYGISIRTLRQMYEEWETEGVPKSVVEARYLRTRRFHGKLFSRLVLKYLGIETQHPHKMTNRVKELEIQVARLRNLLRDHGIQVPDDDVTDASER